MGLFNKKVQQPAKGTTASLGQDPQELHDLIMPRFRGNIDKGLASANINDPALRAKLIEAISSLVRKSLQIEDESLLTLVLRICQSYEINESQELSND